MKTSNIVGVAISYILLTALFFKHSSTAVSVDTSPRFCTHIDGCLVDTPDVGDTLVYVNTTCVCSVNGPDYLCAPEWVDMRTGKILATDRHVAYLHVTPDYLGKEKDIVCRGHIEETTVSEIPLPPVSDSPMSMKIDFDVDPEAKNHFFTNTECPETIFFTCSTPKRELFPVAYAQATITVFGVDGETSEYFETPWNNRNSTNAFHYDFRFILSKPGRGFVKCTMSPSVLRTIVVTGLADFHVEEKPMKPMITKPGFSFASSLDNDHLSVEIGKTLDLVCSVPSPWSDQRHFHVQFHCGPHGKDGETVKTILRIDNVDEDLNSTTCLCESKYAGCNETWTSKRLIIVYENQEKKETFPQTWSTATTRESAGLVIEPEDIFSKTIETESVTVSVLTTPENSLVNSTDNIVDEKGEELSKNGDDDNDDKDDDELRIIIIVAGMGVAVILAAILFFCIGFKAGSKKKNKYSMKNQQPAVTPNPSLGNIDTKDREPVEEAYEENIKMVCLKPDLIYSFPQSDYLDPVDPPLKPPSQQHSLPLAADVFYAQPMKSKKTENPETKQDKTIPSKIENINPRKPSSENVFYDNALLSKLHVKIGSGDKNTKDKEIKVNSDLDVVEEMYQSPTNNQAVGVCKNSKDGITKQQNKIQHQEQKPRISSVSGHYESEDFYQNFSQDIYEMPENTHISIDKQSKIANSVQQQNKLQREAGKETKQQKQLLDVEDVYERPSSSFGQETRPGRSDTIYENQEQDIYERPSSLSTNKSRRSYDVEESIYE